MQKSLLKTSLFGFSKAEVCEYITRINAEFNEKTEQLAAEHAKEKSELLAQIAALNEEVGKHKQANADIAQALFDAQTYAAELRAKADEEYRAASDELLVHKAAETEKLNEYSDRIEAVRQHIAALLADIDGQLELAQEQTENLAEEYRSEEGVAV